MHRILSGIAGIVLAAISVGGHAESQNGSSQTLIQSELATARDALIAKKYSDAVEKFRRAADHGSPEAQFYLGLLYQEGQGVQRDYAMAVTWYRQAAEGGSAEARYNLANMFEKGLGVPQDTAQALKLFRKVAESGLASEPGRAARSARDTEATRPGKSSGQAAALQNRLNAAKIPPEELAAQLQQRASQGDPEAQYQLGQLYEQGRGVPFDAMMAEQWKSMATAKGYKPKSRLTATARRP